MSRSPKMNIVRCPLAPSPQKWAQKPKTAVFPCKIALRLKNVCYKVSLCENRQRKSCKAFIGLTISVKMIGGGDPCHAKIWPKFTHQLQNAGCQSIFARSASAVTPREKRLINTNRKSTTSFIMSLRWTSKLLREGVKNASVPNFNNNLR